MEHFVIRLISALSGEWYVPPAHNSWVVAEKPGYKEASLAIKYWYSLRQEHLFTLPVCTGIQGLAFIIVIQSPIDQKNLS